NTAREPSVPTVTARGSPARNLEVAAASSGYSTGSVTSRSSHDAARRVGQVSPSAHERHAFERAARRGLASEEGAEGVRPAPAELPDRRILFVHAHPDDETISTGATMAHYASTGAHVTLVTCTLGEEGEIHVPALAGLAADRGDQLGGYRLVELERACQ